MLIFFFSHQQTWLFSFLLCSCISCRQGGERVLAYCGLDLAARLLVVVSQRKRGLGAASGCPAWVPSPRASVLCTNRAALPCPALFLVPVHPPSSIPPQSDAMWLSVGREGSDVGTMPAAPLLCGPGPRLPPPLTASPDGSEDTGAGRRALCSPGTHPSLPRAGLRHTCSRSRRALEARTWQGSATLL